MREWFLIGLLTGLSLCLAIPIFLKGMAGILWWFQGFSRDEAHLRKLQRKVTMRRREEQLLASLEDLESGYIRPRTQIARFLKGFGEDGPIKKTRAYTPSEDEDKLMSGEVEPETD